MPRIFESPAADVVVPNFGVEWAVVVDSSVPEEDYRTVWESLDDWAGMVGCEMRFKLTRGTTPRTLTEGRTRNGHFIQAWGTSYGNDHTEGLTQYDKGMSSNVTWKTPETNTERAQLPNVIRHELGHAFGLDHLPAPSIMQAKGYDVMVVTGTDATEYDRIWCQQ